MAKARQRQKLCSGCGQAKPVLYRVQLDALGQWQFVCAICWPQLSQDNPHYVYGGTWKAKKR